MEVQSNDMTVASRALWEHAASSKKKKKSDLLRLGS